MRATAIGNYDRRNFPIYVLLDVINVLDRLDGKGYICGISWSLWREAFKVDIYIAGAGRYWWAVDRRDYGKNMPALHTDI